MDAITLKDLSPYKTIFSVANNYGDHGGRVSNSAFKIERNHRLLWHNMENIKKVYTGADERNEIGPKIMSMSVMELYNISYLNEYDRACIRRSYINESYQASSDPSKQSG